MSSKVINCPNTRPHPYQDTKYGKNRRVCNLTRGGSETTKVYRDTVTGLEVSKSGV